MTPAPLARTAVQSVNAFLKVFTAALPPAAPGAAESAALLAAPLELAQLERFDALLAQVVAALPAEARSRPLLAAWRAACFVASPELREQIFGAFAAASPAADAPLAHSADNATLFGLAAVWLDASSNADKAAGKPVTAFYRAAKVAFASAKPAPAAALAKDACDPTRWQLVVGRVTKVTAHPNSEKLWCEEIDVGEVAPRQIGSGLRQFVAREEFEGQLVVVLANLKPKNLSGFLSHGMILCASSADHSAVELLQIPPGAAPGDVVRFGALTGQPDAVLSTKKKDNALEAVLEHLHTDAARVVKFKEQVMTVRGLPITSRSLANAQVG